MTAVALVSAAVGAGSALWWLVAYRLSVKSPGRIYRAERHHLMATGGFAFGICGSLGLAELDLISIEWATTVSCGIVAVTMLWRIGLLHRAQHKGKHER